MVKPSTLANTALAACFFAFCVIALGAFTRLIDAGLGCPDWPGCYGFLAVPDTSKIAGTQYVGSHFVAYKAWAEMIHRYAVSGLSIFIIIVIGLVFSKKEFRNVRNSIASVFLILLLAYQIVLGQLTVTLKLLPVVVTQHLLGGFLIISTLWLIYLMNKKKSEPEGTLQHKKIFLILAIIGFVLVMLQILLGAWTSTNYASLSCIDFPFCINDQPITMHFKEAFNLFSPVGINYEGGVLPEAIRQTIQMTHRIGAMIVTGYLFSFMLLSVVLKKFPTLLKVIYLVMGLLCIQLCLGIANVIFKLPLVTAIFHNLIAVTLLLTMITLVFKIANINKRQ